MCIRDRYRRFDDRTRGTDSGYGLGLALVKLQADLMTFEVCLLYTSDAADERSSVDLGGRRILKKKNI